jgi:hypothetical protein
MAALEQTTLARLELETRTLEQSSETSLIARLRAGDLTSSGPSTRYAFASWAMRKKRAMLRKRLS